MLKTKALRGKNKSKCKPRYNMSQQGIKGYDILRGGHSLVSQNIIHSAIFVIEHGKGLGFSYLILMGFEC